jgi:2-polyprenyl-3-methyl-5-hydroxy-6-metoxy-1,4-benzoquinol methylase
MTCNLYGLLLIAVCLVFLYFLSLKLGVGEFLLNQFQSRGERSTFLLPSGGTLRRAWQQDFEADITNLVLARAAENAQNGIPAPVGPTLYTSRNPTRRWLQAERAYLIFLWLHLYTGKPSVPYRFPSNAHLSTSLFHASGVEQGRPMVLEVGLSNLIAAALLNPFERPLILEVGCGSGLLTELMSDVGKVMAVDVEANYVDMANNLKDVRAIQADISKGDFTERVQTKADVVVCSEVVEHITDSQTALKSLYACLKPGGMLILTTPNPWSTAEIAARLLDIPLIASLARVIYREPVKPLGHINRMPRAKLLKQIRAAGFEVWEQKDVGLYIPLVAELMGNTGKRICGFCSQILSCPPLRWLCWTQFLVLSRPLPAPAPTGEQ